MYGYCGKILYINLTDGRTEDRELSEEMAKNYLGGTGLAARMLFDMKAYEADPLSGDNPLIVMTGPLTGTSMPGAGRHAICARSPLTGGFGAATCGGFFGAQLKFSGYDGIVVLGESPEPVYIFIDKGEVKIVPAGGVWGKTTSETTDIIAEEQGVKKVHALTIGPAGENKVLYACVMGGTHNSAGRTGMGAVMGAKRLKAIAVTGGKKQEVFNKATLFDLKEKIVGAIKEDVGSASYTRFGTDGTMQLGMLVGDVPTKNWSRANWEQGSDKLNGIAMADTILTKNKSCFGCPIACKRVVTIPDGPYQMDNAAGPEYETAAAMGTLNMIDDLAAVTAANVLCNDLGMDTISAGSSIAFLTECFEKGLITEEDTGGIKLEWGNPDTLIQLLTLTAQKKGVGEFLSTGVKRMSEKIGKGSEKFAVHSKGMEAPMHDPRAYHGLALAYATCTRGACHISHYDLVIEMGVHSYPEMGISGDYEPLTRNRKAEMVAHSENLGTIVNSLVMCMFAAWPLSYKNHILPALNAITGLEFTIETLTKAGERGWLMQRAFNNMCGFTAKDDVLTERALLPHPEGKPTGLDEIVYSTTKFKPPDIPFIKETSFAIMNKIIPHQKKVFKMMGTFLPMKKLGKSQIDKKLHPDFEHMIREYYIFRQLDSNGIPRSVKLSSLQLDDVNKILDSVRV